MTKFCTQCGATVSDTARFCNKCGNKMLPTQPTETYQPPAPQAEEMRQDPYQVPYSPPYPGPAGSTDLKPNIAGMLCYPLSFITGIVFLILTPYNKDSFVRFHAYQSIFFGVAMFILNILLGIVTIVTPGFLDGLLFTGLRLLALGGTGWLMYQAYLGNQFKLPVIGDMAENQASKH